MDYCDKKRSSRQTSHLLRPPLIVLRLRLPPITVQVAVATTVVAVPLPTSQTVTVALNNHRQ